MSENVNQALHDIHTATNDVLKGYDEMLKRAEPDVQEVIRHLVALHRRHAAELQSELLRMGDTRQEDSSIQGTVNKVTVILRDWLSSIDSDALPAVRSGEEALRDEYADAIAGWPAGVHAGSLATLKEQFREITAEIEHLPKR